MSRAAALLALALTACGKEPTVIDGSSPAAFERTAAEARRDLPIAERLAFDAALKHVPGARTAMSDAERGELARRTYSGMTAAEVIGDVR